MSRFLILGLLFLASCAGDQQPESTSIGAEREYNPLQVSQEDDERFQMICAALNSKVDVLRVTAPTNYDYTFSFAEKGCKDKELGTPRDIKTKVVAADSMDGFRFKMENNDSFYFSNVESASEGVMAEICKNAGRIVTPVQTSSTGAMWFSLGMDASMCQSDGNSICVYFQRGTASGSKTYKIHTEEWIKFKMMNPNRGFFTERIMKSSANCSDKDYYMKTAVLK